MVFDKKSHHSSLSAQVIRGVWICCGYSGREMMIWVIRGIRWYEYFALKL